MSGSPDEVQAMPKDQWAIDKRKEVGRRVAWGLVPMDIANTPCRPVLVDTKKAKKKKRKRRNRSVTSPASPCSLATFRVASATRFRFGKHKGKTLVEVFRDAQDGPAYLEWILRTPDFAASPIGEWVKRFMTVVKHNGMLPSQSVKPDPSIKPPWLD